MAKLHSTNYQNTFILVADDCAASKGEIPPGKGDTKTLAQLQFELVQKHPYQLTSDDVLFLVFAQRNDLEEAAYAQAREQFFSKGQACFRASPLPKRWGWGVHSDKEGKIALWGCETAEYKSLSEDPSLKILKAMKSAK